MRNKTGARCIDCNNYFMHRYCCISRRYLRWDLYNLSCIKEKVIIIKALKKTANSHKVRSFLI